MKTQRSHLLTCSLFLLTCIQPAKAMEEDGSQRDWKKLALIGGALTAGASLGLVVWRNTHRKFMPTKEEPEWLQKISADLASCETVPTTENPESAKSFDEYPVLFAVQLLENVHALRLTKDDAQTSEFKRYPVLAAAGIVYTRCQSIQGVAPWKLKQYPKPLVQQMSTLCRRLLTSQEILNEIAAKKAANQR